MVNSFSGNASCSHFLHFIPVKNMKFIRFFSRSASLLAGGKKVLFSMLLRYACIFFAIKQKKLKTTKKHSSFSDPAFTTFFSLSLSHSGTNLLLCGFFNLERVCR
jgi:hypothetical protein